MKRGLTAPALSRLASLQDLEAMGRRDALATACAETDRAERHRNECAEAELSAGQALDSVFTAPALCLDQLALANFALQACGTALAVSDEALNRATEGEGETRELWQLSHRRAEWFADESRQARRRMNRKVEDSTLRDTLSLRLAMATGACDD